MRTGSRGDERPTERFAPLLSDGEEQPTEVLPADAQPTETFSAELAAQPTLDLPADPPSSGVFRDPPPGDSRRFSPLLTDTFGGSDDSFRIDPDPPEDKAKEPLPSLVPRKVEIKPGVRFGPFLVLERLGQGRMGAVFLAAWEEKGKIVALKIVPPGFAPSFRDRLVQEIQTLSKLHHPHIVEVVTTGTVSGQFYCAMEFIAGVGMEHILTQRWFPLIEKVRMLAKVAKGLHYAHSQGVIHRDVKPTNILVTATGFPRLVDFGLARDTEEDALLTNEGTILGTPEYMAPEQARGWSVGPAADIYGLGAILYEILCGQPPHIGKTVSEVLRAAIIRTPTPPSQVRPGVPRKLEAICLRAISTVPEQRHGTAGQLADDLEAWCEEAATAHHRPVRRGSFGLGLASGLGATLLVVLALWLAGLL